MVSTPQKVLTIDEFLQLPDTKPASEFINGQIVQKTMPSGEHSAIQIDLATAINSVLKVPKIARAFPELRCAFGGRVIVPDIAVYCYDRICRKDDGRLASTFTVAPDWIIEILSPGQNSAKVLDKILHCLDHGTQMGWLIAPEEQLILVQPSQQRAVSLSIETPEAIVPVPAFAEAVKLTIGEIFSWLTD